MEPSTKGNNMVRKFSTPPGGIFLQLTKVLLFLSIGMTSSTKPDEFLRAILESIAFGMKQLLEIMETESPHSTSSDSIK